MLVEVFVVWGELEVVDVDPIAVVTWMSAVGLKRRWYMHAHTSEHNYMLTVIHYSLAKTTTLSLSIHLELSLSMMCGNVRCGGVPA